MRIQFHSGTTPARMARARTLLVPRRSRFWPALLVLAALAFGPQPTQAATAVTEAWVHHFSNVLSNSVDRPSKVVRDSAGDIIVAGTSDYNASGPDILTIKYSGVDGSMLWQRRQQYSASALYKNFHSQTSLPVVIAVDASGNVVVSGSTEVPDSSESENYTAKYARATGAVLWEKRYYSGGGRAIAVSVDPADNVVVTGESVTVKYAAANGAFLWEKRSDGRSIYRATAIDNDGNVVLTGSFDNGNNNGYYTAKYAAADGGLLWEKLDNSPANGADVPSAVAVDANGNVIVTGTSQNNAGQHYYTIKYAAADGAVLWEQQDDGSGTDFNQGQAHAIVVDASGNVVVTGGAYDNENGYDYYTVKYAAANGALLWEKFFDGPANAYDEARAVAVDASGNVVVTGRSARSGTITKGFIYDYYTAKYAAADGVLLWERRVNGPNGNDYSQHAIAVDGDGNIVVTGSSQGVVYTAKYAPANGALLWERRDKAPDNNIQSQVLAVDSGGNVVVTGYGGSDRNYHSYTARYAAADGALLWEKRNSGGGQAVAMDGSGNVIVTGFSSDTNFNHSYSTAKYAAQDGALLWEKPFSGGSLVVAVDGSDNVLVTGYS